MLLIGDIKHFHEIITKNIAIGINNSEVIPCFSYSGDYTKEIPGKEELRNGTLNEIIEEVIYYNEVLNNEKIERQFLITREIGSSNGGIENTRISLLYEHDGVLCIWHPLLSDIFKSLKNYCIGAGKKSINIIEKINTTLGSDRGFTIREILDTHYGKSRNIVEDMGLIFREGYNSRIHIPIAALYSLIKNIMISEDMRFKNEGNLGRYLMQLAIYDFVVKELALEEVFKKYGLNR